MTNDELLHELIKIKLKLEELEKLIKSDYKEEYKEDWPDFVDGAPL